MKKILVTGGAGFIGSEYIDYVLKTHKESVSVLCADKLTYAGTARPEERFAKYDNFAFCKVDICDNGAIDRFFDDFKPDYVVNFAAETHVDRSISDPSPFFLTNVVGTSVLLDAAKKYKVKRFHQISTDEVYGSAPETTEYFESDKLNPSSPYSASKAAADLAVLSYAKTFGLDVTITRSSNNYGRYQFPEKLIPVAVCSVLSGKKIPLYGKGESVRDWLYVTDNCKAIDYVLRNGESGQIYNVSGRHRLTNACVIKKIINILGVDDSVITYVPDRAGADLSYDINDDKLRKAFTTPLTDFDFALFETVQWYKNNKDWWQPLFNRPCLTFVEPIHF